MTVSLGCSSDPDGKKETSGLGDWNSNPEYVEHKACYQHTCDEFKCDILTPFGYFFFLHNKSITANWLSLFNDKLRDAGLETNWMFLLFYPSTLHTCRCEPNACPRPTEEHTRSHLLYVAHKEVTALYGPTWVCTTSNSLRTVCHCNLKQKAFFFFLFCCLFS